MRALEYYRSLPRYLAARTLAGRLPALAAGSAAPLRLVSRAEPQLPGNDWVRVAPRLAGICGSDLATVTGRSSFYFSPLVSMPFIPGHEVVGELLDPTPELPAGTRVVLDPLLSCRPRGLTSCGACAAGHPDRCDQVTVGQLAPGIQTGFCTDTGGGWSERLVAHPSQLRPVPDALPDARAVLVEPLACAVHSVGRARVQAGDSVLVVGAGAVGLFVLLALRARSDATQVIVVAKHRRQSELARQWGATEVVAPRDALAAVRRSRRAFRLTPERGSAFLLGGVDVAIDCAGSADALDTALRGTRAGGRVVLAGLPTDPVDLTPLWFRELELVGAYATAAEPATGDHAGRQSSFELAMELAGDPRLDGVVGATYPLSRWREALDHALAAGRLGTVKVAFDLGGRR